MTKRVTAAIAISALVLAGCDSLSDDQSQDIGAGLFGAGAAAIVATALDANAGWTIVAAAAGAAAGVLIARNSRTNECAYADGQGGYTTRAC